MHRIIIISSILLLFNSCEQLVNTGDLTSSQKYPTKIGHEWEYYTEWKLEYYDTTGNIDSTSTGFSENTIVRIIKESDTLGFYKDLVLFESFDLSTPQNINKTWYLNADSGLFAIAYSNAGSSQFVWPKQRSIALEQVHNFVRTIGVFPGFANVNTMLNPQADTIQYYSLPRKVLTYPLTIGSRWIELTVPFFRERYIQKKEIINTNSGSYNCYKLESNWTWVPNLEFTDYVDLNSGLVMREIIADSMMIVTVTNPDNGAFVKSSTISKLVREKK